MATVFPLVAAGWRAAVGWLPEVDYGMAPVGTSMTPKPYNWVGAVQQMKGTVDKQPIFVYRMDGSTDFPAYLLKGQRNVNFTITYWPQDIGILTDMINTIGTGTVSHSFIIQDFDTGAVWTVTGAIANTVTISGKTNAALEVTLDYWCQNILRVLPAYVTFPNDPGNVPFYFAQESVQIPSGVVKPQALTFTGTITNNLSRVPQFNTDVIRSLPTLTRKADGDMKATFATLTDFPNEGNIPATAEAYIPPTSYTDPETSSSGFTTQTIRVVLGRLGMVNAAPTTTYYLDYTGAVLPKIDLTLPIADLVALDLPWTATGASVGSI